MGVSLLILISPFIAATRYPLLDELRFRTSGARYSWLFSRRRSCAPALSVSCFSQSIGIA
ncbi:MAG: hypothetical protein KME19_06740 [Microcoleus vaginatus WJT46-NPBG5]|nr:hypothetical protein [Microcoleus vaginatus WJT46-NPBG5]